MGKEVQLQCGRLTSSWRRVRHRAGMRKPGRALFAPGNIRTSDEGTCGVRRTWNRDGYGQSSSLCLCGHQAPSRVEPKARRGEGCLQLARCRVEVLDVISRKTSTSTLVSNMLPGMRNAGKGEVRGPLCLRDISWCVFCYSMTIYCDYKTLLSPNYVKIYDWSSRCSHSRY